MKVAAIIQARMGSSRLPGKVLKEVLNKPLLIYQLERVRRSKFIDEIVVATTDLKLDDVIVDACCQIGIPYYRGSETDVLKRYYEAAHMLQADIVIRLTADCPLIDPLHIDKVIKKFLSIDDPYPLKYVSNTLKRTYPRGMDTEVFSIQALKEAHRKAVQPKHREHVTLFMVENPSMFRLTNVPYEQDQSHHRWTVDTMEDFLLIENIIGALDPQNSCFTLEDILDVMEKHPKWKKINEHIAQKKD